MPGLQSMLIGGGILLVGLCITIFTMSGATGDTGVVAYGAIIIGAIQFIAGGFQFMAYTMSSKDKKADRRVEAGLKVVIRGMLAIAAADGELESEEVEVIQIITNAIFDTPIGVESIVSAFTQLKAEYDYDITKEFSEIKSLIDPEFADLAIKSMFMVALCDGDFDKREKRIISNLARYLRITPEREADLKSEAELMLEKLYSPSETENEQEILISAKEP